MTANTNTITISLTPEARAALEKAKETAEAAWSAADALSAAHSTMSTELQATQANLGKLTAAPECPSDSDVLAFSGLHARVQLLNSRLARAGDESKRRELAINDSLKSLHQAILHAVKPTRNALWEECSGLRKPHEAFAANFNARVDRSYALNTFDDTFSPAWFRQAQNDPRFWLKPVLALADRLLKGDGNWTFTPEL